MTDKQLQTMGIVVTILLHIGLGSAIAFMDTKDEEKRKVLLSERDDFETIEAALAFKAPEAKKRLPQKKKNPKVAPPPEVGVSRDADAKPVKRDDTKPPPPDFVDPTKTFGKVDDIDLSEEPTEGGEDQQVGSPDGSKWGTQAEAKGDPYVGELVGRVYKEWKVPSLEAQTGTAHGCVRLDKDGKIVVRKVERKSGIANLDRSVSEALKNASDMEEPVPEHLFNLLTRKGICIAFKLEG